jgi:hypothetical protein
MTASLPLDALPAIPKTDVVEQKPTSSRLREKLSFAMTLVDCRNDEVEKQSLVSRHVTYACRLPLIRHWSIRKETWEGGC